MFTKLLLLLAALGFIVTPALAEVQYQVTPDGKVVMRTSFEDVDFSDLIESFPEGRSVTFCLHSTSEFGIDWYLELQGVRAEVGVDIVGGFIQGSICDSPNWDVSMGFIDASSFVLEAFYVGSSSCAEELDMIGTRTPPGRIWSGTYGWWGANDQFPHVTELYGVSPCP